jgi:hypothetical protein
MAILAGGGRDRDLGENAERVALQLKAGAHVLVYGDARKLQFAGERGERPITLVDVKTVFPNQHLPGGGRFFKVKDLADERWIRADELKQFVEASPNGTAVAVY